jgi:intracellular sulfur oxidation DsrE/DsrF family protein
MGWTGILRRCAPQDHSGHAVLFILNTGVRPVDDLRGHAAYSRYPYPSKGQSMFEIARRGFFASFVVALLALLPPVDASAQGTGNKVVFQVSDAEPQKWNLALNNAKNVQDDLGVDKVELQIVVYGPGIGMLKGDSPVAARIEQALKNGIKVVACENTMRAQKLVYADMLPKIGYVPAGVVELMKKQQEGYAYIRP